MIGLAVLAAQIASVPIPPGERPLGFETPSFKWSCNLVDMEGRVFPISGKMPAFSVSDKYGARKPLTIVSPEEASLSGQHAVVPYTGGESALFNVKLSTKPKDKIPSITIMFESQGEGNVTVYREVPTTKEEGYFAAGVCKSDFRGGTP